MDIGKIKNSNKFYEGYEFEPEIVFQIKEKPELNIHLWEGYIDNLFDNLIPYKWSGLTKDYQECSGPWTNNMNDFCDINALDYYNDLKNYIKKFYGEGWEEEIEAIETILFLLKYAVDNNLHVQIKID